MYNPEAEDDSMGNQERERERSQFSNNPSTGSQQQGHIPSVHNPSSGAQRPASHLPPDNASSGNRGREPIEEVIPAPLLSRHPVRFSNFPLPGAFSSGSRSVWRFVNTNYQRPILANNLLKFIISGSSGSGNDELITVGIVRKWEAGEISEMKHIYLLLGSDREERLVKSLQIERSGIWRPLDFDRWHLFHPNRVSDFNHFLSLDTSSIISRLQTTDRFDRENRDSMLAGDLTRIGIYIRHDAAFIRYDFGSDAGSQES